MAERAEPVVHPRASEVAPPEATVALGSLVLAERRERWTVGEDWTARGAGGRRFRVWRVVGLDAETRAACADDLRAMTHVAHPNLVPVLAAGDREADLWVVTHLDASRSLRRLLCVAALTPPQAARIAVEVLDGLQALHLAGRWHGRLDETAVRVGEAGDVRLAEWGLALDDRDADARRADDCEAVRHLLARLGACVPRVRTPQAARLVDTLLACGEEGGGAALAGVRQAAEPLLEDGGCQRAARELGVLVGHLEREPADLAAPPPARRRRAARSSLPMARPQAAAGAYARPSRRGHRLSAGLSLLILVAAGLALATIARPSLSKQTVVVPPVVRAVMGTAAPAPKASANALRAVPVTAPPAAGPVTGIELQPLRGSCRPGASCPVQVTVRLQPQPAAQEVRWSFRVFDRCTGATTVQRGATATALAGWAYVFATSSPTLPAGHPLALVAVTEAPAAAASPAVLAGASGTC
jgi:Protein tyrosine and serine/threonine kinase